MLELRLEGCVGDLQAEQQQEDMTACREETVWQPQESGLF